MVMSNVVFLSSGTRLGKYTIVKNLGAGGFGITYLVQDGNQNKYVIKELYISGAGECSRNENGEVIVQELGIPRFKFSLSRFINEAKILMKLNHRAIVKVKEYFLMNSTAYYVMEYLEGVSLDAYVSKKGQLSSGETISLIFPIFEAVKEMHSLGLWHRDIKPANIMVTNGHSVLIDFGTVKVVDEKVFSVAQIKSTFAAYTPTYAAPEQMAHSSSTIDHRADIYALGGALFFMLQGKPIYSSIESILMKSREYIPEQLDSHGITGRLKDAIEASMKLNIEERPNSIQNMQAMLVNETMPIPKLPEPLSEELPQSSFWQRNWFKLLPMVALALLMLVLISNNGNTLLVTIFGLLFMGLGMSLFFTNDTTRDNSKKLKGFRLVSRSLRGSIVLKKDSKYKVGRDFGCDVVIPSEHQYVSREHLSFSCIDACIIVRELKVTQGTYISNTKLEPNRDYRWEAGDLLTLVDGNCTMTWEYA